MRLNRAWLPFGLAIVATVGGSLEASAQDVKSIPAAVSPSAVSPAAVTETIGSGTLGSRTLGSETDRTPIDLTSAIVPPASIAGVPIPGSREASAPIASAPTPGATKTTAASLLKQPEAAPYPSIAADPTTRDATKVGQTITPGTATRSSSSYVGVGGNIGLVGDSTDVGNGSFVLFSKIGLTERYSVRPAVMFGDSVTFLLPFTLDFNTVGTIGEYRVSPYIGGGFAFATGSGDAFNFLATAGVDVPLGSQFTATAGLNLTFLDNVSFGLLLGLGYNF